MTRILEDLFYGNIQPNDKEFIRDSRYGEAARAVAEIEQKLLTMLDGEARELFVAYVNTHGDYSSPLRSTSFRDSGWARGWRRRYAWTGMGI